MEPEDGLDSVLLTVENPVRRKILRQLAMEPSYQLRISKELGFSQQLVAKHLDSMEGSGMVSSQMEASPHGPRRKEYLLSKSISLTIDFAPNLFRAKMVDFDPLPEIDLSTLSREMHQMLSDVIQRPRENHKLRPLGSLINEIDKRLEGLEDERSILLYIRQLAMKEAGRALSGSTFSWDEKRILSQLIEEHGRNLQEIRRRLNLDEASIREVLADLEKSIEE